MGRPARLIAPVLHAPILPDVLPSGLTIVFCGSAAGRVSAQRRAYYAGPGNRFWPMLHAIGLTPHRLRPEEFPQVTRFGIGLTDVCKSESGADSQLSRQVYDAEGLRRKIRRTCPRVLAFNGLKPARAVLGRDATYGRQDQPLGSTIVFVLPSTSRAANGFWDERHWHELAKFLRGV